VPVPIKWKLVAGSAAAAIIGVSTAAGATTAPQTAELELHDVVAVSEVTSAPVADLLEGSVDLAVDADDSLASPFDSPDSPESRESPESIDSPESPDSPESIDSPDSP
jgi:hypothetical protein